MNKIEMTWDEFCLIHTKISDLLKDDDYQNTTIHISQCIDGAIYVDTFATQPFKNNTVDLHFIV